MHDRDVTSRRSIARNGASPAIHVDVSLHLPHSAVETQQGASRVNSFVTKSGGASARLPTAVRRDCSGEACPAAGEPHP
jgi:hypothetical protein